ncbi:MULTISPECIES: ABC transporter substrate-binding protein [Xanthobacteraceae]|uniref:ABC transporter substrate-binding protein n=1 Tax=Xanthobacteraceae TaxID=335928 RepID=UPI00135BF185|nr:MULTISPECIES: ABC transporter substrate-binding protein [Xanthobacteraceae]
MLLSAGTFSSVRADEVVLTKSEEIYKALPEKIRKAGVINAATAADYPPFEFLDENNKLVGADIDLAAALSKVLGVTLKNNQTEFSNIMPGLQAGRFDVGMSSMGDYISRQKTVDFVDYFRGGTSFLVRAGAKEPAAFEDVCGTAVGALKGTSSETQAEDTSKKCVEAGKAAVKVSAFPTQNAAVLALTSGRIDSVSGDSATNGYSANQIGDAIKNVGLTVYNDRPYYGIAVPKDSPLYQPLFDAMGVVMKSGAYSQILKKWGLESGAISEPMKNQGSEG